MGDLLFDILALLGAALVVYGAYQIYPPAAPIVAGAGAIWASFGLAAAHARRKQRGSAPGVG